MSGLHVLICCLLWINVVIDTLTVPRIAHRIWGLCPALAAVLCVLPDYGISVPCWSHLHLVVLIHPAPSAPMEDSESFQDPLPSFFLKTVEATVQVETDGAARTTDDGLRWKQKQSKHTERLDSLERMSTWLILRFYTNLGHLFGHASSSVRVMRLLGLSAVSPRRLVSQHNTPETSQSITAVAYVNLLERSTSYNYLIAGQLEFAFGCS